MPFRDLGDRRRQRSHRLLVRRGGFASRRGGVGDVPCHDRGRLPDRGTGQRRCRDGRARVERPGLLPCERAPGDHRLLASRDADRPRRRRHAPLRDQRLRRQSRRAPDLLRHPRRRRDVHRETVRSHPDRLPFPRERIVSRFGRGLGRPVRGHDLVESDGDGISGHDPARGDPRSRGRDRRRGGNGAPAVERSRRRRHLGHRRPLRGADRHEADPDAGGLGEGLPEERHAHAVPGRLGRDDDRLQPQSGHRHLRDGPGNRRFLQHVASRRGHHAARAGIRRLRARPRSGDRRSGAGDRRLGRGHRGHLGRRGKLHPSQPALLHHADQGARRGNARPLRRVVRFLHEDHRFHRQLRA